MMKNTRHNFAILTLVHNRQHALTRVLNGIENGQLQPAEVVVVYMNEDAYSLDRHYSFPIRSISLQTDGMLNLGAARNLAMQESTMEYNIFLDVDCIPASDFISHYAERMQQEDALYTGRVRYLPEGFQHQENWQQRMQEISAADPVRSELTDYPYELFWSLNFGCSKAVFEKIGGFDTQYAGYGGEDTDFAFQARANGVALYTVDALAYHQYHPSYHPPLNHLKSIVDNARHFARKWRVWPMEGWLNAFEEQGFLDKEENDLTILRLPNEEEIRSALKSG